MAKKDIEPLYLNVTVTTPSEANVSVKRKAICILGSIIYLIAILSV